MVNNYFGTSSFLSISPEQVVEARTIVEEITAEIVEDEDYVGITVEVEEKGVWFYSEENANIEHVEIIARKLIDALQIDVPFYCSCAFTCSKPRIDEFGGACFVIVRGHPTHHVDAVRQCQNWVREVTGR